MISGGNGRTSLINAGRGDGIQRRSQRNDSSQGRPALRTPVRAVHTSNLAGTTDNNDGVKAISDATHREGFRGHDARNFRGDGDTLDAVVCSCWRRTDYFRQ
ncbi:hypothetical protein NicSoilB4_20170 [Arthrobacter sp. NicSoilB4]|nr:hypothetical protein NicSoilB4_20170 [Arthrobacter sp. NicSoilB4]